MNCGMILYDKVKAVHKPGHAGVAVTWNNWVGSNDPGPRLSKSACDFVCLRSSSKGFSYSVCLMGCNPRISRG